ncbi:hypothetical protein ACQPZX_23235 [Actinoplanes sp. CA-142083]|uniref:hypothetical protein n=1 Tax=Actinoplanes sp. CA-142083 TaxID=3239903 RepID=UPI003D914EE6
MSAAATSAPSAHGQAQTPVPRETAGSAWPKLAGTTLTCAASRTVGWTPRI